MFCFVWKESDKQLHNYLNPLSFANNVPLSSQNFISELNPIRHIAQNNDFKHKLLINHLTTNLRTQLCRYILNLY